MPVSLVLGAMRVRMKVEVAAAPANQQSDGKEDDQGGNRGLGPLLEALRQVRLEEQDRQPENDECEGMAEAPEDAELGRAAAGSFPAGGDERGDRRDVIRVGRVTQSEQRGNEEDDED